MAKHMNTELVSQFTEDAYATVDQICEHPSCGIQIRAGEPCLCVATINPGQVASSYHTIPDPHIIWQSVNAAQRKSSVNPPPVVAVSNWTNASMGLPPMSCHLCCTSSPNPDPPPMSHRLHCTSGPNVAIPTSWQGSAASAAPSRPIGYSSHHGMYAAEHQRWAKATYSTPIAITDTISLEISAMHEASGHKKKTIIANICEGKKDIDASIDAPDLIRLALDMVLPKLHAFGDTFAWRDEEFTVQDSAWVDLSTHPPFKPYFLLQCMQPAQEAGKALTFKTKQFALLVVIPESQWQEFELWQEESKAQANQLSQLSTNVVSPVPQALATASSFSTTPWLGANIISSVPQMSTTAGLLVPGASAVSATTVISIKRTHEQAISSTSGTMSPPQKLSIPPALQLCSPNCDQLKQALKIGGGTDLNVKQAASESPPFNIPHVHFVDAGLAPSFFPGGGKPSSKTGTTRAVFLLEEVINCRDGDDGHDFTKFIHNMDPNPLLNPEDYGYDFVLFLALTQHVQYVKTGGLAFISDYQGIWYSTLIPT
ncbi:hypothetical protein EDD22DRAFT_950345 [Suillus occidentalis]|nr:hypothetical protein EDD22DRAFT_950345 [Suillus occidentalis]